MTNWLSAWELWLLNECPNPKAAGGTQKTETFRERLARLARELDQEAEEKSETFREPVETRAQRLERIAAEIEERRRQ